MAQYEVTVEKLHNCRKHPNADSLSLANVGSEDGFQVVTGLNAYKDYDEVVYVPEGGIVPDKILDELGLKGRLGGKTKNVVKAIKLRGELSQGLIIPEPVATRIATENGARPGDTWAEALGIVKFVPEVAIAMSGTIEAAPDLVPMFEVESVKKYGKVFTEGEQVEITEKLHGTCFVSTYETATDTLQVSSKGISKDGYALKEDEHNLYWRAAHEYSLKEALATLALSFPHAVSISLFGEVFGEGVQDLHYGANGRTGKVGFAAYAMLLKYQTGEQWVSPHAMLPREVPCVPVLYVGPYSKEKVAELTDGMEQFSGRELHIREGVVVQAAPPRTSPLLRGLALVKSVSADYLTRGKNVLGEEPTEMQ